jgi:hypothetical protein
MVQQSSQTWFCIRICVCVCVSVCVCVCVCHLCVCVQGAALSELQSFFPALAASGSRSASPEALIKSLLEAGRGR